MKIAVGADHAGYALKQELKRYLETWGHEVSDFGTDSPESVDYPDFAHAVGSAVVAGACQYGILVCGTGIGMAIAANKVPGVRAANADREDCARLSREHNDANVLSLGARVLSTEQALALARLWLETPFAGGRHQLRVDKMEVSPCAGAAFPSGAADTR